MMDFQSQSYKNYLEAHTRLNNYTKILSVAVDYLFKSKETDEELSELLNDLILKSGERWTPRVIKNSKDELISLKNDLIKSAIIWVYSAFDIYFKQIEGMLSAFFSKEPENKHSIESSEGEDSQHKVIELYEKLNWDITKIETILEVVKFYDALRHSIAHNLGTPSGKLIEIANSPEFKNAITTWKTKFPKKIISPPPIVKNDSIELSPHHSILYSDACLRVACDINEKLFEQLGLKYFIDKTLKKHLLEVSSLTEPKCTDFARYMIYHLKNDFNISINPYSKINDYYMDGELIKQYKKRYYTLKNNC